MNIINIFDADAFVVNYVRSEIKVAQDKNCKYLLIVCDTFEDYKLFCFDPSKGALPGCDYAVYCKDDDELRKRHDEFEGKNMQEVRGIYQVLQEADLSNIYCFTCGETREIHCHTGIEMDITEILEHMSPEELTKRLEEGESE